MGTRTVVHVHGHVATLQDVHVCMRRFGRMDKHCDLAT